MQLDSGHIEMREDGGIGWLVFNNPGRLNAISQEMIADAIKVIETYEASPTVKVVILRGAGEKAFISGGDISKFEKARADARANDRYGKLPARLQEMMANLGKPLIAMIHGYCLGGGMAIALAADLRFASSNCRLGIPAALRGIVYPLESTKRLVDLVGPSAAKDLMFSGRQIHADEALRLGLINRVFAPDELEQQTIAYAQAVAQNAPLSVRAAKFFIGQLGIEKAQRDTHRMQSMIDAAANSDDFEEATRAFLEKRKPVFRGA
jgi:enoyl-CoA hydratase/carnithine racemase